MTNKSQSQQRRKGDIIFREGDAADCAYIIESGRVEISVEREGKPIVLGELVSGEILGEMAMIDEFNRTATARVVEDSHLTVVTPRQIQQRIESSDPVVRSLLEVLLSRYRSELTLRWGAPSPAKHTLLTHYRGIQKIRFENDLIRDLETDGVSVVYQPICRLDTKAVVGFEALVRWDHPDLGTVPPEDLIALAEETDLINTLENRVFTVAIGDLATLQAAPGKLFMSINVSPRHTSDLDFLNQVSRLCDDAGQETTDIVLELTESVLVDLRALTEWARAAKDMGFRLTVDDFGTGFASLEYLTRLNPDIVKIDQSFIGSIIEDARTVAVLRRILEMAKDLDVQVIAEGAETAEHLRVLTGLGVDMAQGFEIGRPLPAVEAATLLAGTRPAADGA